MFLATVFERSTQVSHSNLQSRFTLMCLLLLSVALGLTSTNARAQQATTVEIGSRTLDADRAVAPRWTRVDFDALTTGEHTIRVTSDSSTIIRFSVFQVLPGQNTRIALSDSTATLAQWTGALDESATYYLGVWAVSGSGDFTATIEAVVPTVPTAVIFGQGTIDNDRILGSRWVRHDVDSLTSGNHTITVAWDSGADVRFRVFEANGTVVSSTIQGTNPGVWSGELNANTSYYIGLWVTSGSANYEAIIEAETNTPVVDICGFEESSPQLSQQPTVTLNEVMDYGTADFSTVLGRRHNVVRFSPRENGPITIALRWEGEQQMNMAVFNADTGTRLALVDSECVSGTSTTKSVTLNLNANTRYRATAWVNAGTAEWVMRKVQTVTNPNLGISAAPDSAQRPNIVVINTDDQRSRTIDFMPAIQELLVQRGVTYPNTTVPTPSCCPSRASMLSGQYVHNNLQFQQQRENRQIFENTFQRYLQEAGYLTGHSGKYLHWLNRADPAPPYWDRWTYVSGGFYGIGMNFDGRVLDPGGYTTDIIFERAKDYLRDFEQRDDDNPWFVHIAPLSPHEPWTAEYRYLDTPVPELEIHSLAYLEEDISDKPDFLRFRLMGDAEARAEHELRARNLLSVDREVAELIEYLEASGELDNTLIIFTSDNGSILGEHQTEGKFTPYRDSVEVPMIISWPGQIPQNVVNESFVSHVDIAPTILNAAGIDTSGIALDGHDIFAETRDTFFLEYFFDPEANGGRIGDWASLRTDTYQYTEWYGRGNFNEVIFREYYDMTNDPYQLENLYENGNPADDPDFTALSNQLRNGRNCVGTACP